MAMAVKSEFGESGFDVWNQWSSGAKNYKEKDARDVWKSIHPTGKKGTITISTLIKEAKNHGWVLPDEQISESELRERKKEAAARRKKARDKALVAEKALEAGREVVSEAATRIIEELTIDSGKSAYLDRKKVGAFDVRFVERSFLVVCTGDPDEGGELFVELITDKDAVSSFYGQEGEKPPFKFIKPGALLIPARDIDGRIWNIQIIWPVSGKKSFLKYGCKQGTFHLIGTPTPDGVIGIAEGYATAVSVHQAMDWPVAVAWDAGNLEIVALNLRKRYPDAVQIILGDDDHENPKNPGRIKACRAANLVGGVARFPHFETPAGKTDWNDLHVAQGLDAVREQLNAPPSADELPQKGEQMPERVQPSVPTWAWHAKLARANNGSLKSCVFNLDTILQNHETWAGAFALDEFANQINRTLPVPYNRKPGIVTTIDGMEISSWMGNPANYGLVVSGDMAMNVIELVASRNRYNPVVDYLDSLTWDGEERVPYMLADFFGTAKNDYTAAVSLSWLISAVARVRKPGCKVDTMVILEGEQGVRKSTAIRDLCGEAWFAEATESPQNKDFFQGLPGRWFMEIGEMESFNKADLSRIKLIMSSQVDHYRPTYGRYVLPFPRQCIFVGTTNEFTYLKDDSGARRFLPVRTTSIDADALREARDQLWAEADVRFGRGEKWWEFPESTVEEQDARYDEDVWRVPIYRWLYGEFPKEKYPEYYYPIETGAPLKKTILFDVMRYALGFDVSRMPKHEKNRVAKVMRKLGWEQSGTMNRARAWQMRE